MYAHPVDELYRKAGFEWGFPRDLDLETVVDTWAALPLLFQPGTEWNYSVGLDVLGRVLEVITGQRLDELMRTRLLEPLGMDETTWFVDEAHAPRLAALYSAHPTDPQGRSHGRDGPRHAARAEGSRRRRRAGQHRPRLPPLHADAAARWRARRSAHPRARHGEVHGQQPPARRRRPHRVRPTVVRRDHVRRSGIRPRSQRHIDPVKARVPGSVGEYAWGGAASTAFWIDPAEDLTVQFFTQLLPSSTHPIRSQLKQLVYQSIILTTDVRYCPEMQLSDLCIFTEPQQGASYDTLLTLAQRAEALGFGGFFRSDHFLRMGGVSGRWTDGCLGSGGRRGRRPCRDALPRPLDDPPRDCLARHAAARVSWPSASPQVATDEWTAASHRGLATMVGRQAYGFDFPAGAGASTASPISSPSSTAVEHRRPARRSATPARCTASSMPACRSRCSSRADHHRRRARPSLASRRPLLAAINVAGSMGTVIDPAQWFRRLMSLRGEATPAQLEVIDRRPRQFKQGRRATDDDDIDGRSHSSPRTGVNVASSRRLSLTFWS